MWIYSGTRKKDISDTEYAYGTYILNTEFLLEPDGISLEDFEPIKDNWSSYVDGEFITYSFGDQFNKLISGYSLKDSDKLLQIYVVSNRGLILDNVTFKDFIQVVSKYGKPYAIKKVIPTTTGVPKDQINFYAYYISGDYLYQIRAYQKDIRGEYYTYPIQEYGIYHMDTLSEYREYMNEARIAVIDNWNQNKKEEK